MQSDGNAHEGCGQMGSVKPVTEMPTLKLSPRCEVEIVSRRRKSWKGYIAISTSVLSTAEEGRLMLRRRNGSCRKPTSSVVLTIFCPFCLDSGFFGRIGGQDGGSRMDGRQFKVDIPTQEPGSTYTDRLVWRSMPIRD